MNLDLDRIAAAATASPEPSEGTLQLPKAVMGALAGAVAAGLLYGVVGRFVAEISYLAVLIGSASGLAAFRLGGKASPLVGGVAAVASLVMVLAAKVVVGAPAGTSWVAYHTTLFDILFCYVANPVAAFAAGGTGVGRGLLRRLPF
ncbi:MAG TPA: hypothetical protein RMH99_11675 [Sandaracinaceae bacterium LLY-WYZ-13_1]|nr:hypothetical protein [Sandaracinaceae bacterium LLY-WYZ-13_1]